jgi:hypothetical protein
MNCVQQQHTFIFGVVEEKYKTLDVCDSRAGDSSGEDMHSTLAVVWGIGNFEWQFVCGRTPHQVCCAAPLN